MTSTRLAELARVYRDAVGSYRVRILDMLYADGRNNSILALELSLGLPEGLIQRWYKQYRIIRRRYRRQGLPVPFQYFWPPPGVRPGEAAEAAQVAAGGRGEERYRRRDTFAAHGDGDNGVRQRKARRMELYDPAATHGQDKRHRKRNRL